MLSSRAILSTSELEKPWRFPPRPDGYDPKNNPQGTVVFNLAENALVYQDVEDFMKSKVNLSSDILTYGFSAAGGPRLPKAMAVHLNEYFNPHTPLVGDDIVFTASATSLHNALAFSIGDPGDGILLSRPCYGRFEIDFSFEAGMHTVWADSEVDTCFKPDVVQCFEEALERANERDIKIKGLIIVNPHNPLARCYPKDTLLAIMKFCQKHRIHFISDEIYGLSVFESPEPDVVPFTSVLAVDTTGVIDSELLHVIYGMAKDYGCPGLRLGALITRSKPMLKSLKSLVRFHAVSGPSVAIATAMLEDREWCRKFVTTMRTRLSESYRLVTNGLRRIGVNYLPGSNAGMFVWIDLTQYLPPVSTGLSHAEREVALGTKLFEGGVLLQPLDEHALCPGWFRLVYTNKPEIVEEGLRRLGKLIGEISW